jgi:hypothetical protein
MYNRGARLALLDRSSLVCESNGLRVSGVDSHQNHLEQAPESLQNKKLILMHRIKECTKD